MEVGSVYSLTISFHSFIKFRAANIHNPGQLTLTSNLEQKLYYEH